MAEEFEQAPLTQESFERPPRPAARAARPAAIRPSARRFAEKASPVLSDAVRKVRGVVGYGADWVQENPITALIFAGVLGLVWFGRRKSCPPIPGSYVTAGVWADLAKITGQQSSPPWNPAGSDLDVRTAQIYLNRITGSRLREDGILGPKTAAALRSFQTHNGIYPSGKIDVETSGALEYLFFAVSPKPELKAAAAMSPTSIARLETPPVTYTPYPMPAAPPVTYAPYPMPGAAPAAYASYPPPPPPPAASSGVPIPPELLSALRYYQTLAQTPPTYYPGSDRTGIQSISMSDYRHHYDVPAHFEDWGPGPDGGWDSPYGRWG
jgi:peptidoglycan hydrolase-like protein with peptidoglycan-binding domain